MDRIAAKLHRYCAPCFLAFFIPACTSVVSYKLPADSSAIPPRSFPYALQKTKLATAFTVTLAGCKIKPDDTRPAMQIKIAATTTQTYEADPLERYYIDYGELIGFFKTTNLKVITANDQTLQTLNAEVNDQTLQVTGALLQSAVQIGGASIIGGIGVPRVSHSQFPESLIIRPSGVPPVIPPAVTSLASACSEAAEKALATLDQANAALKKAILESNYLGAGTDPVITLATDDVTKARAPLTATITIAKEPMLADLTAGHDFSYPVQVMDYVKTRWVSQSYPSLANIDLEVNGGAKVPGDTLVTIKVAVEPWSHAAPNTSATASVDKIDGLVIRQPALASMRVCMNSCGMADALGVLPRDAKGVNIDLAPITRVVLPQMGKRLTLPLHNSLGTDVTLALALAPDGSVNTLSMQSNTTAAAGLGAVSSAAGAYSTAITARNTAITASNGAAVTSVQFADTILKAQADCLAQQALIVKAGGTPTVSCN